MSKKSFPRLSRRHLLLGAGGAAVTLPLPFLEGLVPRSAQAAAGDDTFAVFFRQANGVASAQETDELGSEPERFWPRNVGALTEDNLSGRALEELLEYRESLLCVGNVNMRGAPGPADGASCEASHQNYFGDGHAQGAIQSLTAQGPQKCGLVENSEANGESLDFRIGRELNPGGRDSLFLYAGPGGWLGGPCISYRGAGRRLTALNNPQNALQTVLGVSQDGRLADVLDGQFKALLSDSRLSSGDRQRLEIHQAALSDLEVSLECRAEESLQMQLDGLGDIYDSTDGDEVWTTVRAHMDVAALAIACGFTRSVALQVGSGNDGGTNYRHRASGNLMENYHYISHRRTSHGTDGAVIAGSDLLHHEIDRQFALAFKYLLDRLSSYDVDGDRMLDRGVAVWHNDLGNGPAHSVANCPWVLAGNCGGYFKQGEFVELTEGSGSSGEHTHAGLLNAIGTAVGCRTPGQEICNDFGDADFNRTPHPDVIA